MDKPIRLVAGEEDAGARLDVFLASRAGLPSRSAARKLIDQGRVTVDGAQEKGGLKLRPGAVVIARIPPPKSDEILPEPIPLSIVYEDDELIVVDKPRGMVVHPAPGNETGTLVHALLAHCGGIEGVGAEGRPGIVHRLDKDTSGLMVVAKTERAHGQLARQLKDRKMERRYQAIVHGNVRQDEFTVDAPIGRHPKNRQKMAVGAPNARRAVTHVRVLERFGAYTLIEAVLETGRTHQIRVHMAYRGHPLMGDTRYGPRKPRYIHDGQALHAYRLGFAHPLTQDWLAFEAPLPAVMEETLNRLRGRVAAERRRAGAGPG